MADYQPERGAPLGSPTRQRSRLMDRTSATLNAPSVQWLFGRLIAWLLVLTVLVVGWSTVVVCRLVAGG